MTQKSITSYFKSTSNSNSNINLIFGEKKYDLTIYTDGACSNNGKSTAKAGIGVYSKDKLNISERIVGKQTNQRAELYAILKALKTINIGSYNRITIYTDSQYSIDCLTKWVKNWTKNGWKDKKNNDVKNKDIIKPLYSILSGNANIILIHIRAHTGKTDEHSIGNSIADKLACNSLN
tara:strand:- start:2537 stop:3070 length:534 start_codon:yes stop_codon:yes gene_type:complete